MKDFKIKVCGMREPENIRAVAATGADMLGFIFFEKSKRDIGENKPDIPDSVEKIGVFVNAEQDFVIEKTEVFNLDYVQLHGDETLQYCRKLKSKKPNLKIIKVFSIGEGFDFGLTEDFEQVADLFLFDTKGKERGGNGVKFNWQILQDYKGKIPFLLSGGIRLEDAEAVKNIQHAKLFGVDVNSGFELAPGLKKAQEVASFVRVFR